MRAKNNSEKKIGIIFFEIINILYKNKVKYWICHGTLLDIIRDKQLNLWVIRGFQFLDCSKHCSRI